VFSNALSLIAGIVVARFLGKDVFGEYGMIKTTLIEIAVFSTFGLGYTITRYIAQYKEEHADKIHQLVRFSTFITFIISGSIAILVLVFANQLAMFLKAPQLATMLRISSIAIVFNAITTTQIGQLAGFAAFKTIAINKSISGIVIFILSVILTYFYALEGAVIALTISLFFNAVINYVSVNRILQKYNNKKHIDNKLNKEILKFSLPIALQESSYAVTYWFIAFLIVRLSNYGELGIYNAAAQWGSIISYIPSVLGNVMLSYFSESVKEKERNGKIVNRMLLLSVASTLIPFLFVLIFMPFITSLYGATFIAMNTVLSIVMFTAVIQSIISVYTKEFIAHGENWFLFLSRIIRDILILVIAITFIKVFTERGTAFLFAVTILLMYAAYSLLLHFRYRKHILHNH